MKHKSLVLVCFLGLFYLNGCASTVAGAATGAAIEVAKVPFQIAGALVGAVAHTAGAIVGETSDGDDE